MQKGRSEVWINGKKTRRRLTVDSLPYAHHLAGELKLIFFTSYVLDRRIRKSQIERLIRKGNVTGGRLNVVEAARVWWSQNVQNRNACGPTKNLPRITPSANIQDCLA